MPWKTMDLREQRVQFVIATSRREKSFSALCQEFGISRPTGMLWKKRYQESGLEGIAERSRRPNHSPGLTAAELEDAVVAARQRYPDWGARKLQVVLQREGIELTRSTVHRILLRRGLVREWDRHTHATERFERSQPNELWQMDFKSPRGWNAPVGPLSIIDDHSRYVLTLQIIGSTHSHLVRQQLQSVFHQVGVPDGMLMDHGIPWWSARGNRGATELNLWLMKQGIRLHWSGIRHPQTQGKVERFHGELQRALERRGWGGLPRQQWLDQFRWEHNHVRPHEALALRTPSSVWHPSRRTYDPQPRPWEYPMGAHVLTVGSSGNIEAYGQRWSISKALRHERVQLVRTDEWALVYYCRTLMRVLDLQNQRSIAIERWFSDHQL
jgi:transposase InsO family protein